jgi:hypothetical protein
VTFFVWKTILEKIITMDNLKKRHIIEVEWCCMCQKSGENIDHILVHCEVGRGLWESIFHLFMIEWVMSLVGKDSLEDNNLEVWKMVP